MIKRFPLFLLLAATFFVAGCGQTGPTMPLYVSPSSTTVPKPGPTKPLYRIFSPPPVPPTNTAITSTVFNTSTLSTPIVIPRPTLTYEQALNLYSHGYRVQFSNCSANPGTFTIKHGVSFMLDNRDPQAHVISVGLKNYQIKGYGFAIVSVATAGTTRITCDGGGSAKITVSK